MIRRVPKPGSSSAKLPLLVSCEWTKLTVENVSVFACKVEDLVDVSGCTVHKNCKGHHMISSHGNAFMIAYGFASGDELRYSDAGTINVAVNTGAKTADDVANYCFDRIRGKSGILRKQCNSTRPTNSMRFVASPSRGLIDTIYLPKRVFTNGKFLFLTNDGMYNTCRIKDGTSPPLIMKQVALNIAVSCSAIKDATGICSLVALNSLYT